MTETAIDFDTQLPISAVSRVIFYKRDEITTDLICCDVEADGSTWTFHEEGAEWAGLLKHLSQLPSFDTKWFERVSQPPFARSEAIAFKR